MLFGAGDLLLGGEGFLFGLGDLLCGGEGLLFGAGDLLLGGGGLLFGLGDLLLGGRVADFPTSLDLGRLPRGGSNDFEDPEFERPGSLGCSSVSLGGLAGDGALAGGLLSGALRVVLEGLFEFFADSELGFFFRETSGLLGYFVFDEVSSSSFVSNLARRARKLDMLRLSVRRI